MIDPNLHLKRALRYFHKTGKFPHDQPGYDPATGLVTDPSKPARKHIRTRALPQQDTSAHLKSPNLTEYSNTPKPITQPTDSDEGSDTSTERTPYWLIPIVASERAERESQGITPRDYGKRWQSAYRDQIGPMPECGPGDHEKAEAYWQRICQALVMQEGEVCVWTPNENNRLHLLERKWRARKDGEDAWFELRGTARGALTAEERVKFEEIKRLIKGRNKWAGPK